MRANEEQEEGHEAGAERGELRLGHGAHVVGPLLLAPPQAHHRASAPLAAAGAAAPCPPPPSPRVRTGAPEPRAPAPGHASVLPPPLTPPLPRAPHPAAPTRPLLRGPRCWSWHWAAVSSVPQCAVVGGVGGQQGRRRLGGAAWGSRRRTNCWPVPTGVGAWRFRGGACGVLWSAGVPARLALSRL